MFCNNLTHPISATVGQVILAKMDQKLYLRWSHTQDDFAGDEDNCWEPKETHEHNEVETKHQFIQPPKSCSSFYLSSAICDTILKAEVLSLCLKLLYVSCVCLKKSIKKKTRITTSILSKNKVHPNTLLNNVSNTIISLDQKLLQNITSRSGIRNTCLDSGILQNLRVAQNYRIANLQRKPNRDWICLMTQYIRHNSLFWFAFGISRDSKCDIEAGENKQTFNQ
jgi:hypothetical protein